MKTSVWVTHQFPAYHYWPDAPEQYKYLGYPHRHLFHVRMEVEVTELNRQIEFIDLKSHLARACQQNFRADTDVPTTFSCEQMAHKLFSVYTALNFKVLSVSMSEDGENGSTVTCE